MLPMLLMNILGFRSILYFPAHSGKWAVKCDKTCVMVLRTLLNFLYKLACFSFRRAQVGKVSVCMWQCKHRRKSSVFSYTVDCESISNYPVPTETRVSCVLLTAVPKKRNYLESSHLTNKCLPRENISKPQEAIGQKRLHVHAI